MARRSVKFRKKLDPNLVVCTVTPISGDDTICGAYAPWLVRWFNGRLSLSCNTHAVVILQTCHGDVLGILRHDRHF